MMKHIGTALIWVIGIASIAVIIALIIIFSREQRNSYPTTTTNTHSPTTQRDIGPLTGEEGILVSGVAGTILCRTPEIYETFWKALAAKDTYGMQNLLNAGLIFAVQERTRVLVIDIDGWFPPRRRVRVLEGDYRGDAGWVPAEWVKKH